jgi:hypothetical protein
MPSDPKARTRVRIALLLLFVFMVAASAGTYYVADLGRLQDLIAARQGQAALQGITDASQIEAVLRQSPSNRFLRMMAMATRAADETNATIDKLSDDIEPPAISKAGNPGTASRSDLEALRRDLKTAEANATALAPRTIAVLKAERDTVEKYAALLQLGKDARGRLLDALDKRHAEITALASRTSSARADFYRAYQNYIGILVGEFGAYKFTDGQFIFPLQRTADRYNVAAQAMTAAAKPLAELDQERKTLLQSQQARWLHFVKGE